MMRKNLVVVRAGKDSRHGRWFDICDDERSYDIVVSYFDEEAFAAFRPREGVSAILVKGGKWDGLYKTFTSLNIDAYDYFWLPDDDIACDARDVNEIFRLCHDHKLAVAQPALTRDSYFSHFLFSQCPGFTVRYTNYVEIMVPCLSRNVLRRALPHFEATMSGFGLDYIWSRWKESGPFRVAVLDKVAVHHTRPVGKVLRSAIKSTGRPSAESEEASLKAVFDLAGRTVPLAYAGIQDDGQLVTGRVAMGWRMASIWWRDRNNFRDRSAAMAGIIKVMRRQLTKQLDMRLL